jgi:hypothetical protein
MDEDDTYPYILGSGWGTTLTVLHDKEKKIKKNPIGFHSVKAKKNGRNA